MTQTAVVVVGEAVADITIDGPAAAGRGLAMTGHAGGSPANVAVGLARLGVRAQFAGRISREGLGPFLRAHLTNSGVDLELCVDAAAAGDGGGRRCGRGRRSRLLVLRSGHGRLAVGALGAAARRTGRRDPHRVAGHRARPRRAGRRRLDRRPAHDASTPSSRWIPNVRPALVLDLPGYRERLDALIDLAQVVKVSDEDLLALHPGRDPLEIASEWARRGPELVVVTHGARGATALTAGAEPLRCEAEPVDVVDTIGAGDAFMAGLLAFLGTSTMRCAWARSANSRPRRFNGRCGSPVAWPRSPAGGRAPTRRRAPRSAPNFGVDNGVTSCGRVAPRRYDHVVRQRGQTCAANVVRSTRSACPPPLPRSPPPSPSTAARGRRSATSPRPLRSA